MDFKGINCAIDGYISGSMIISSPDMGKSIEEIKLIIQTPGIHAMPIYINPSLSYRYRKDIPSFTGTSDMILCGVLYSHMPITYESWVLINLIADNYIDYHKNNI